MSFDILCKTILPHSKTILPYQYIYTTFDVDF